MTTIGDVSHIILCSAITGSGTSVSPDAAGTILYIKSLDPEFPIEFDSKVKNSAYGKSRITPDIKYRQGFICTGTSLTDNLNIATEFLLDRYIAKAKIYLLCELPQSGGTFYKKSFYTDAQAKVYYCLGVLKNFNIRGGKGRVYKVSFSFVECWQ